MALSEYAKGFQLCGQLAELIYKLPEQTAARIAVLQEITDKWAANQEVVVTTPNNRYGEQNETSAHQALGGGPHNGDLFEDLSEYPQSSAQELCIGSDSEDSTHQRNQLKHTQIQTKDTEVPASHLQSSDREDESFGDSRASGSETGGQPSDDPGHNEAEIPCASVRNLPKAHSIRKQHVCDICGKKFNTSSHLKTHQQTHTGKKPFQCILCERKFTQNSHLRSHWQKIHKLEILHCKHCKKSFYDPDKRREHEQNDHPEQDLVLDGKDMNQYACDKCEESFQNFRELQTHYKVHIRKSLHCCLHCSEFFPTKSSLYKHAASLPTRTLFTCPECGKRYFFYKKLEGHIKTNHSEGQSEPVVSERDSAQSSKPTQLMPADHSQDKKGRIYQCPRCEKTFNRNYSLVRHIKTHTNKKRHACDKCSKTYAQKYSLIRHNEMQHKPFVCAICQEFFNGKAALNKHALDHQRSEKQTGDAGSSVTGD